MLFGQRALYSMYCKIVSECLCETMCHVKVLGMCCGRCAATVCSLMSPLAGTTHIGTANANTTHEGGYMQKEIIICSTIVVVAF